MNGDRLGSRVHPRNVQTRKERVNLVFRIKISWTTPRAFSSPGMSADADIG